MLRKDCIEEQKKSQGKEKEGVNVIYFTILFFVIILKARRNLWID